MYFNFLYFLPWNYSCHFPTLIYRFPQFIHFWYFIWWYQIDGISGHIVSFGFSIEIFDFPIEIHRFLFPFYSFTWNWSWTFLLQLQRWDRLHCFWLFTMNFYFLFVFNILVYGIELILWDRRIQFTLETTSNLTQVYIMVFIFVFCPIRWWYRTWHCLRWIRSKSHTLIYAPSLCAWLIWTFHSSRQNWLIWIVCTIRPILLPHNLIFA